MKRAPDRTPSAEDEAVARQPEAAARSIDRVIRWCAVSFIASSLIVGGIAWHAVMTNQVAAYLNMAGVVYLLLCIVFMSIIGHVFVRGHLGSSREIEAPKLELF